ncbi:hypothetical protein DEM91_10120 [Prevotella sp. TCVGH]|jgi:hypothetical protein|uniref:radical SAM/SPASM domain-containing protein n=1 Tax=Prevotella sp. TCVGH TaxID=2182433 RepID=UPI00201E1C36|nr:radical SAM protein [Prevotella sp. TCVGH]MCL6748962.1 hypothetical protein [Prevotella sp. TCVGH]
MDFKLNEKIQIMDSYIKYIESIFEHEGIKTGLLDEEHLAHAKALRHELKLRKKCPEEFIEKFDSPINVQFELTSQCNQHCLMCYNQSGSGSANDDLNINQWIKIAEDLASVNVPQVIISGGEPTLLGDDLFKIMDIFHEIGSQFILITNGMLINEDNIHKFVKYDYVWMQFSIDGATESTHDYIRGAKGAFNKVVHAVALARAHGIPVGIASTIQKKNLNELSDLIDLAYYLGAFKHHLGEFMYTGRAIINKSKIELTGEDIIYIGKTLKKKRVEYAQEISIAKPFDPALNLRTHMCQPATGIVIRPNGEVRIDCQAPGRIGNVKEKNILDIWKDAGYKSWSHPKLLEYISKVMNYKDLNEVYPRTHYDPDLDLSF